MYELGLFQQIRYPFQFNESWQRLSLHSATDAEQKSEAILGIRQAFFSSAQQAFFAQEKTTTGQVTIPAMHTFHIVGLKNNQSNTLKAIAVELNILHSTTGFIRIQLTDPQNPLRFLTSANVHQDTLLQPGTRSTISLTFSEDITIDLPHSFVRYHWQNASG